MPQNLLQLPENTLGKDYVIGDVHGSGLLTSIITQLGPHDRLFCVGDLFDRGGQELEVYHEIIKQKNIYIVRGNHEHMFLHALSKSATAENIINYLINGGAWVLQDPQDRDAILAYIKTVIDEGAEPEKVKTLFQAAHKKPEIRAIFTYLATLPYIISVGDDTTGFHLCHADLPYSDQDIQTLQTSSTPCATELKYHMLWARNNVPNYPNFTWGKRDIFSRVVYCGHSILQTAQDAVRQTTNHINLDGGAYDTQCFIVVNHSDRQAHLVYAEGTDPQFHQEAVDEIHQHFEHLHSLRKANAALKIQTTIPMLKADMLALKNVSTINSHLRLKYQHLNQAIATLEQAYQQWTEHDTTQQWKVLDQAHQECRHALAELFPKHKIRNAKKGLYLFRHPDLALPLLQNITSQFELIQRHLHAINPDHHIQNTPISKKS